MLGFAEDYTRIVMNVNQELVLLRTSNETIPTVSTNNSEANGTLEITKVNWKLPYV